MALFDFLRRSPRKKRCARCERGAAHGYSNAAESDSQDIAPLCLPCLVEQLRRDYSDYRGRVIVVEPAAGLPCYVFRSREFLRSQSPSVDREVETLLQQIGQCASCQTGACCLWIGSRGLNVDTFGEVLEKGPAQTLLAWGNPSPVSLCAKCAARRISEALHAGDFEYLEICSPHDRDEGIAMPLAY